MDTRQRFYAERATDENATFYRTSRRILWLLSALCAVAGLWLAWRLGISRALYSLCFFPSCFTNGAATATTSCVTTSVTIVAAADDLTGAVARLPHTIWWHLNYPATHSSLRRQSSAARAVSLPARLGAITLHLS